MDFGAALATMKGGKRVSREAWGDPARNLGVQQVREGGDATLPYFLLQTEDGEATPYTFPHCDVLADDWQALEALAVAGL